MCGIAGCVGCPRLGKDDTLAALAALRHRGPDDEGMFSCARATLGMRRLSIIDLETGRQPVSNENGNITAVFNGEIYNYLELTAELQRGGHVFKSHGDSETLVHLYEDRGAALVDRLRGMFAFALWDERAEKLLLARDRFGKKPLYYAAAGDGGMVFASEIKALKILLGRAGIAPKIRPQAIYDYLSLGVVPQPGTVYEGVFSLPPGHVLEWENGKSSLRRYWELDFSRKLDLGYAEAQERMRDKIAEAVRLRLRSDVPLGLFLSGGIDSGVIAAEAAKVAGDSLNTFTVALDDRDLDESELAAKTAARLGVRNTVLRLRMASRDELANVVRQYDQPYADSSAIPSLAISRLAREHVKVVLNGDGGDEMFAGYRRYVAARMTPLLRLMPAALHRAAAGVCSSLPGKRRGMVGFSERLFRAMSHEAPAQYLAWVYDGLLEQDKREVWRGAACTPTEAWVETILDRRLDALDMHMNADVKFYLPSDLLVKMDIATMAASVEARSPLLDHELAEFAAGLPDRYRLGPVTTKQLLRDAYRNMLPAEVVRGGKKGFGVPLGRWFASELQGLCRELLLDPGAKTLAYLDGAFLRALLDGRALRRRNWEGIIYSLLVLELWLRENG